MLNISNKKLAVVIIVFISLITVTSLYLFNMRSQSSLKSTPKGSELFLKNDHLTGQQEQVGAGLPLRIKIPKINIITEIEHVGLTPEGAVGVPIDLTKVAWFNLGPRPGEIGNAVITGHYGWKDKKNSAFDNLFKLRKGDKIYVEDDQGKVISFIVSGTRRYSENAKASEVFESTDGKLHLNLITCEGTWNKVTQSYPTRLVVFADKE